MFSFAVVLNKLYTLSVYIVGTIHLNGLIFMGLCHNYANENCKGHLKSEKYRRPILSEKWMHIPYVASTLVKCFEKGLTMHT